MPSEQTRNRGGPAPAPGNGRHPIGVRFWELHRRWLELGDITAREKITVLVLQTPPGSREAAVLDAMKAFCEAWAGTYDAVFYCCDRFDQHQAGDSYRSKVLDLQPAADRVVRSMCATVGQRVIDIPPNMTTA